MRSPELDNLIEETQTTPDSFDAWMNLARFTIDRYIVGLGEKSIAKAVELRPREPLVLDYFGKALNRRRNLEQALAVYQNAIEIAPDNASIWTGKGVVEFHLGKADESNRSTEKALEIDPGFSWAVSNYCNRESGQDSETLLEVSKRAIEHNPDSMLNWSIRYKQLLAAGNEEEAKEALDEGLKLIRNAKPDDMRRGGITYLNSPRGEEALAILEEVFGEDPVNINLVVALVQHYSKSDPKRAEELAKDALEFDPESPMLRSMLAFVYSSTGNVLGALELMRQSQESSPEDPLLMVLDTFVTASADESEVTSEDRARAIEHSRKLVSRLPNNISAKLALASNLLYDLQTEEANEVVDEIVGNEVEDLGDVMQLANILSELGRNDKAIEYAEQAARIDEKTNGKRSTKSMIFLMLTYLKASRLLDVRNIVEDLVETSEDNPWWSAMAGRIHWLTGDQDRAKKHLESAIDRGITESMVTLAALKQDKPSEVEELLRQAITETSPEDDEYAVRARAMVGLGRYDEAIHELNHSLRQDNKNMLKWRLLLNVYQEKGIENQVSSTIDRMIESNQENLSKMLPQGEIHAIDKMMPKEQIEKDLESGALRERMVLEPLVYMLSNAVSSEKLKGQ